MASLGEYFKKDFSRFMTVDQEHTLLNQATGQSTKLNARVHLDFEACSKFVSIYLPAGAPIKDAIAYYLNDISHALKATDGVTVQIGFARLGPDTSSEQLTFTGRVFVYAEDNLESPSMSELLQFSNAKGLHLVFRSKAYCDERNRYERPLAFISHDWRDKATIAEPIAIGLQKLMCPVWYDQFSLKVGDSLRESIERGIKEADTCILILSKHFLENGGWTKAEFDSIYTKEIIEKKRVILPVWAGVTKQEIYEYSPRLADRVAANIDLGIEEIIRRLHHAIEDRQINAANS